MYSITETELSCFCSVSMHFSRFNDTSHSSMIHFTHELLSQTLEEKPHIYVRPSIISRRLKIKIFIFTGVNKGVLSGILTPCLTGAVIVMVVVVLCHKKGK